MAEARLSLLAEGPSTHRRYLDDDCPHNDAPLNKKSAYRGLTWVLKPHCLHTPARSSPRLLLWCLQMGQTMLCVACADCIGRQAVPRWPVSAGAPACKQTCLWPALLKTHVALVNTHCPQWITSAARRLRLTVVHALQMPWVPVCLRHAPSAPSRPWHAAPTFPSPLLPSPAPRFTCELEAARAFDRAALCLYGEAAKTNFGLASAKADPLPTSSHILGVRAQLAASAAAGGATPGVGSSVLPLARVTSLVGGASLPALSLAPAPGGGAVLSLDAWRCSRDLSSGPALPQGTCLVSAPLPSTAGMSCSLVGPAQGGQALGQPGQQVPVCCPPIHQQQYLHHHHHQHQPQQQVFEGQVYHSMVAGPLASAAPVLVPAAHQLATPLPPPVTASSQVAGEPLLLVQQLHQLGLGPGSAPPPALAGPGGVGLEGPLHPQPSWAPAGAGLPPGPTWAAAPHLAPVPAPPQALGSAAGLALPGPPPPALAPCSGPAAPAWAPGGCAAATTLPAGPMPSGGLVLDLATPPGLGAPCAAATTSPEGALSDMAAAQALAQAMLVASRSGLLTPHTRVTDLLRLVPAAGPV